MSVPRESCRARDAFLRALPPRGLVLLLVVAKGLLQAGDHLGRGLEHRLELRLVDFLDVGTKVLPYILQGLLHFTGMMTGIACACHGWALGVEGSSNRLTAEPGARFPIGGAQYLCRKPQCPAARDV